MEGIEEPSSGDDETRQTASSQHRKSMGSRLNIIHLAMNRTTHTKCKFYGRDPIVTRVQDDLLRATCTLERFRRTVAED